MRPFLVTTPVAALLLVTLAACADTGGAGASADSGESADRYPEGPMTLLVGYSPGSSTDTGARMMADALEEELDATITVENRDGAGGQVGLTALANAECDGHTFGTVNFPSAIVSVLDESRGAGYDKGSFAPTALQVIDPTAIAVAADSPYQTAEELVQAATQNPGTIRATTTGVASNEHFALLQLQEATGAEFAPVHFPEAGSAVEAAFLGGDAEVLVGNVSDVVGMVENDQGTILGVMESERSPFLPDVPTFEELGYEVAISSSRGYAFPECVPDAIVTKVSEAIETIMENDEFRVQMENLGLAPSYRGSDEYDQYWNETIGTFESLLPLVREGQE